MLFIRSCCLLHVHAPLTHMHLGARTARSAVKLENAHTLSAALPMYAWLLLATFICVLAVKPGQMCAGRCERRG